MNRRQRRHLLEDKYVYSFWVRDIRSEHNINLPKDNVSGHFYCANKRDVEYSSIYKKTKANRIRK